MPQATLLRCPYYIRYIAQYQAKLFVKMHKVFAAHIGVHRVIHVIPREGHPGQRKMSLVFR